MWCSRATLWEFKISHENKSNPQSFLWDNPVNYANPGPLNVASASKPCITNCFITKTQHKWGQHAATCQKGRVYVVQQVKNLVMYMYAYLIRHEQVEKPVKPFRIYLLRSSELQTFPSYLWAHRGVWFLLFDWIFLRLKSVFQNQ